jgi:nucleoside-diphosphate-sugar epimerase
MSKAEGDKVVQRLIAEDDLPAVILRLGALVGPGDDRNLGRLADRVRARKAIVVGSGNNAVPFVDISDVVRALVLALDSERALGKAYNIGNDELITQEQYLSAIAQEIGAAPPRIRVPYRLMYAAAYAAERVATLSGYRIPPVITRHGVKILGDDCRLCIDKARAELGYEPAVPVAEAIRLACKWYLGQRSSTATPQIDS